jgi:hypothetical protein
MRAGEDGRSKTITPAPKIRPGAKAEQAKRGRRVRSAAGEYGIEDAEREPKIKERVDPNYMPAELSANGQTLNLCSNDKARAVGMPGIRLRH